MKNVFALFVTLLLCINCSTVTKKKQLMAGASSSNINPNVGMFIAGDKKNRKFTGVHDSIYAKAVVINNGESSLAIVTLDCIGLLYPDVQKIRKRAASLISTINLPAERIIISSNHVHTGPDVVGIWGASQIESGVDDEYMEKMIETTAQVIAKASKNLDPVSTRYSAGTFGEKWVHNISEPEIDRSLTVLQFLNDSGKNVASLTNFACHPTIYDAVHNEVSADFVGVFYNEMAKEVKGEHLFLQGAIGGWVQPDKENQSFEIGVKRGTELANAVKEQLKQMKPMESSKIQFANSVFELPVSNPGWSQLSKLGVIKREIGETTTTEVAWFSIGSAQFITHPGETPPAYSFYSKELMNSEPKFVMGLTLDAMGYILKPSYFEEGTTIPHAEYLTRMSAGAEAGPTVLEQIDKVIPK
ncbi:neutral/alkaline non-lysosomal ceramidase N-terminal domain-containing protein [Urechidicola vernalis]|uniref:Neutral/alkaline non-lysosomal ceramidase N-terminal domain-containing protein n=1 Tax=Urechidicola vernalis TaxID=3075600 RepID=A0ABU2Y4M8_9FLAO|nr:neutral/alkaline non-lysosomal ceramidase N-terminal domain-containing protein [Urechidicola sp. P050]MDT0553144.1 neutral/alkaline non-lysosomal ceramidase N-terminal domain-containing protein [Urechidicola sp. P050]